MTRLTYHPQTRLQDATAWLKSNNKLGLYTGAINATCIAAVEDMLSYLDSNSDVWTGALWWAAGPWWGDYMFSIEPPNGPAYATYDPIILKYA
jgi:endoglucanase